MTTKPKSSCQEMHSLQNRTCNDDFTTKILLGRRFLNSMETDFLHARFQGFDKISNMTLNRILQSSLDLKLFFADFIFFQKVSSRAFHCAKQVGEKRCKV